MAHDDEYWTDSKGRKVPPGMVSESDRIIDETVREIARFGEELMHRIARFRTHSFDDMGALQALLDEKYGLKRGGAKGNISFTTYDGTIKVSVRVQDEVTFGPELRTAKGLMDEYIEEVAAGSDDVVRSLLEHAFEVGQTGKINRGSLYALRRLSIDHPTWTRAMEALSDSMRIMGSKESFTISIRPHAQAGWASLPINLANARGPEEADEDQLKEAG